MKRELFFLVLIAFILIVFVETRKYMTKKVEPFTNDIVASEPVQLANMGSVPGKAFEFLKAKNQTNATPSCIEPLLNRMNNFLKDYTAPSQDPSSQLLLQSVKADLQRLQDELKSARADPVYVIQLRKRDLYMIQSNFNRLAGVTEGFQSSQCSLDSVVRVIDNTKDLIIKIKQQNIPVTSDINKIQPQFDEAYKCLKNLYNINSTPISVTDFDSLVSVKKDLSDLVLANNPDPPEYTEFIQMIVSSTTMPEFSSYSNICQKGGVALITRDLKETIIDSLINNVPFTDDDMAIYKNILQASANCMNMLQPATNTSVSSSITSIDNLITSTTDISKKYNDMGIPLGGVTGSSGPTGGALSSTGAAGSPLSSMGATGSPLSSTGAAGSPLSSMGATGSPLSSTGAAGNALSNMGNIAGALSNTGPIGSVLSNMSGIGSILSNTGSIGSVLSNMGGYTGTNYWNTLLNTGPTGSNRNTSSNMGGATGSGPTGSGSTGSGSTGSVSGLPGVTSSQNITLAQVKELVSRIDAEILRLS
jgi:hypothetical protein